MKVYVVMSNDFPDCVFADQSAAEAFAKAKMDDPKNRFDNSTARHIYWRVYEFDLLDESKKHFEEASFHL